MVSIEVLGETPLTMVEMKEKLAIVKKHHELAFRSAKTEEYLTMFAKQKPKDIEAVRKKLQELNILRLKENHVTKILDLQPKDIESLKTIWAGENITLKQEDLQKVIECLKA